MLQMVFRTFVACARVRACAREKRVENASACACKIPQGLNEWTLSVTLQCTNTIKELNPFPPNVPLVERRNIKLNDGQVK